MMHVFAEVLEGTGAVYASAPQMVAMVARVR